MKFLLKDEWRKVINGTIKSKLMPYPYIVGDVVACVDEKGERRGHLRIVGCVKQPDGMYLTEFRVSEVKP